MASDVQSVDDITESFLSESACPDGVGAENMREEYDALPDRKAGEGELTRAEFDKAVKRMKRQKATGIDGVPAEVWQNVCRTAHPLWA